MSTRSLSTAQLKLGLCEHTGISHKQAETVVEFVMGAITVEHSLVPDVTVAAIRSKTLRDVVHDYSLPPGICRILLRLADRFTAEIQGRYDRSES
jgi:hypothetical protein